MDSGDPSGIPPKIGRQSVKRILKGAGADILKQGQTTEDSAAKDAADKGAEQTRNYQK